MRVPDRRYDWRGHGLKSCHEWVGAHGDREGCNLELLADRFADCIIACHELTARLLAFRAGLQPRSYPAQCLGKEQMDCKDARVLLHHNGETITHSSAVAVETSKPSQLMSISQPTAKMRGEGPWQASVA